MNNHLALLMAALLLPGAVAAAPPQRPLSDSRLKQLVMEFGLEARDDSMFRRTGLSTVLPRLALLQRKSSPETRLAYATAFTLAYFGRDYAHNVRRLTYAIELWDTDVKAWEAYLDRTAPYEDTRDMVPTLIARLYRRNRDPALIRKLFSWGLDGFAAECADVERVGLLTDSPLSVLNTVRGSRRMTDIALDSLCLGVGASKDEYERALQNIQRARRRARLPLRAFMRGFICQARARGWTG